MSFFAKCNTCRKRKFHIAKRSYIVPKISPKPITSEKELCRKCFKLLKQITL